MARNRNHPALKDYFNKVVGSDISEWKETRSLAFGMGNTKRDFEHKETKEKVSVTQKTYYDPLDEMNVTQIHVEGAFQGKKVKGTLLWKPRLD